MISMSNKFIKIFLSGIIAAAIMSLLIAISPVLGFPRLAVWQIISSVLKTSLVIGWSAHFAIGVIFAFVYFYLKKSFKIFLGIFGGLIFGFGIFLGVQAFTFLFLKNSFEILSALGSLIGHLVFGGILGYLIKKEN